MKDLRLNCLIIFTIISDIYSVKDPEHQWAVEVKGGENVAKSVAKETGLLFLGRIGNLDNIYHFKEATNVQSRTKRTLTTKYDLLNGHNEVSWFELQKPLIREKRGMVRQESSHNTMQRAIDKEIHVMFNDPQWLNEWYLYDARKTRSLVKRDLHVIPVWQMNITGRGVKVTIVDDGIEYTHPDLKDNYDPLSSTDINDNDNDPFPNLAPGTSNEHGTRCASEIAMVANNKICGVGIAYNAKIGGIRVLDGLVNDVSEARALGFNNNHIDIYSASWGPPDNGEAMQMPGDLSQKTIYEGVTKGRQGKGNLYVWASGNGGYYNDSCASDGYVSSIYVFSINSISPDSKVPKYAERCSSTIAATFSSSNRYESKLIAADVHGKCTTAHTGTSASAPYAAGIFALALEANGNLTWRDFKHLLAWTCQYSSLQSPIPWKKNAAGFWVNEYFGFGEMDATKLVQNAINWVTVPSMTSCNIDRNTSAQISNNISLTIKIDGTPCYKTVKFIEHVQLKITFQYSLRGALHIAMQSPHKMNTTLLPLRYLDKSEDKMDAWSFVSVHNWGEDPRGDWKIFIEDQRDGKHLRNGTVFWISLIFHGTNVIPHYMNMAPNKRRIYNTNYNHVLNDKMNVNTAEN